ncbi:MAG TPA: hypothetical protein VFN37_14075 [Candidatus Baltobacteraceae bacterium]|nr:hypothetical protein [Candidatus Baltobacteraceae bacterium]
MLQHMLAAAALTVAILPPPPAASPAPQPSATPALKTIATIRVSARCASIITHANSAIAATLDNDQIIGSTITQLRLANLDDGNEMHRYKSLRALGDLAKNLMMQARSGDDEVKRLRKVAAATKDPQEAKALKEFADELGGALWSQQKVARDLNGFLAYQDFRDMSQFDEGQQKSNEAVYGVRDPLAEQPTGELRGTVPQTQGLPAPPAMGHDPSDPTSTQQARLAADDFQKRIPVILRDENLAAGKVDGAIQGC